MDIFDAFDPYYAFKKGIVELKNFKDYKKSQFILVMQ